MVNLESCLREINYFTFGYSSILLYFIVKLLHLYLFVTFVNVVDSRNHIFLLLGECHPLFNVWTATHVLQFSSVTAPLNFVWLWHNDLSLTINLLTVSFSLIHYPYFVKTATLFCLFSEWNCPTLLCVNVTQMPCVSSPICLCKCHIPLCFLLGHDWPILVLTLCGLPHLIS